MFDPRPEGAKLLSQAIFALGLSNEDAARSIGVDRSSLWYWLTGRRLPSVTKLRQIEKWSKGKVPAASWL